MRHHIKFRANRSNHCGDMAVFRFFQELGLKMHFCAPFMVTLWNRADHYILPCGFFFFLSFFSPNLSGRRLDVCHTLTHDVALVRI